MVRLMGKNVFSLTSEHKIINSRARHAIFSNDITHQNTRFHFSLLKPPGNLTLNYVHLHYTFHSTAALLRAALSWPPRKPRVFARLARWQLLGHQIYTKECSRFNGLSIKRHYPQFQGNFPSIQK